MSEILIILLGILAIWGLVCIIISAFWRGQR